MMVGGRVGHVAVLPNGAVLNKRQQTHLLNHLAVGHPVQCTPKRPSPSLGFYFFYSPLL